MCRPALYISLSAALLAPALGCNPHSGLLPEAIEPPGPTYPGLVRPVAVTSFMSNDSMPAVSPDGNELYFVSDRSGNADIWVRPTRGGLAKQVTRHPMSDTEPTVSPDGRMLAFISGRFDAKGDVLVMNLESRKITRISKSNTKDGSPAWMPDSKTVLFNSRKPGTDSWEIVKVDILHPGKPETICTGLSPAVSPNGRFLAYIGFHGHRGAGGDLWVRDLETGEEIQVTFDLFHQAFPTWSRDGSRIIYVTFLDDTDSDGDADLEDNATLWSVDFKGINEPVSRPRQLTSSRMTSLHPVEASGWIFFTTRSSGQFDIYRCPYFGIVPPRASPVAQWKLVRDVKDPRDKQVALRALARWPESKEYLEARYELAVTYQELGFDDKARLVLAGLMSDLPEGAALKGLCRVRLARIKLEELSKGLPASKLDPIAKAALLNRAEYLLDLAAKYRFLPQVRSQALIEAARAYKLAGNTSSAISVLQDMMSEGRFSEKVAAQAGLLMADIFAVTGPPKGAISAYVKVARSFPSAKKESEEAATKAIELAASTADDLISKVEAVRRLMDSNNDVELLCTKAQMYIADMFRAAGKYRRAEKEYLALISNYGSNLDITAKARFMVAELAESAGRVSEAMDQLEILLQWWKDDPEVLDKAGRELTRIALEKARREKRQGEFGMAVKTYRRLVESEPGLVQAHRDLIALMAARGKAGSMVRHYEALVEENPDNFVWRYCLGLALTYLEPPELDRAQKEMERAIAANPSNPFPHQTLGWILEQRELYLGQVNQGYMEKALDEYDTALALTDHKADPKSAADLMLNLANGFYRLKDYGKALAYCRKRIGTGQVFELPGREAQFMLKCGHAASRQDELQEAKDYLSRALELAVELGNKELELATRKRLAFTLRQSEDYEEAAGQFGSAAKLLMEMGKKNELVVMYRDMGECWFHAGDGERALEYFDKAMDALKKYGAAVKEESGWFTMVKQIGLSSDESSAARGFTAEEEKNLYLTYVGKLYRDYGDLRKAEESYEERLKWLEARYEEDGKKVRLRTMSVVSSNISYFEYLKGNMLSALKYQEKALAYARKAGDEKFSCLATANMGHIISLHGPLGDWSLEKALETQAEFIRSLKGSEVPASCIQAIETNMGILHFRLGTDRFQPGKGIASGLDELRSSMGHLLDSLEWFQKAYSTATSMPGSDGLRAQAAALANTASALFELGSKAIAERKAKEASELCDKYGLLDLAWRIQASFAVSTRNSGAAEKALALLESLTPWTAGDTRGSPRLEADELYDFLATKAASESDWPKFFQLVEERDTRRAGSVMARLFERHNGRVPEAFEGLEQEVDSWKAAISAVERDTPEQSRARVVESAASLSKALASDPRIESLLRPKAMGIDEVSGSLVSGDYLLRYAAVSHEVFGVLLSRSGFVAAKHLCSASALREAVQAWPGHGRSPYRKDMLYELLISPFEQYMAGAKRLYIVPGDELARPFLLGLSRFTARGLRNLDLVLLGTASYLVESRQKKKLNRKTLFIAGARSGLKVATGSFGDALGLETFKPDKGKTGPFEILEAARHQSIVHVTLELVLFPSLPEQTRLVGGAGSNALQGLDLLDLASLDLSAFLVTFSRVSALPARQWDPGLLPALHAAMLGAGVPGFVLAQPGKNVPDKVFFDLYAAMSAKNEARPARIPHELALFGYPGMSVSEAKAYASKRLGTAVESALSAFKARRYEVAAAAFRKALTYKEYLGDEKYLDKLLTGLSYSYEKMGLLDKAVSAQRRLLRFFESKESEKQALNARSRLGGLLMASADYRSAANLFQVNAKKAAVLGMDEVRAVSLANAGDALQKAGNYSEAADLYARALELVSAGKAFRLRFKLLLRLGALYHLRKSDYFEAMKYYRLGLALAERTGSKSMLFKSRIGLCRVFRRMGDLDRSEKELDVCKEIATALGEKHMLADVALETANIAWYRGDYSATMDELDKAAGLAGELSDKRRELFVRNTRGVVLMSVGRLDRAEDELGKALLLAKSMKDESEVSSTLNNLGRVMLEKGDNEASLDYFQEALKLDKERKDLWGEANDHRNIALVLKRSGRTQEAREHLRLGLKLSAKVKDSFNQAMCELALGDISKDLHGAEQAYRNALAVAYRNGMKGIEWRALHGLGRIEMKRNPDKALELLERAIGIVEGMRAALKVEELQSGFIKGKQDLYDDTILLLMRLGKTREAFSYAERARSRAFIDLLGNKRILAKEAGDRKLMEREARLRSELEKVEAEARKEGGDAAKELAERMKRLRKEYEELVIELKRRNPQLASFVSVEPVSFEDIRGLIPDGVLVLEYHLTSNRLVIFGLTASSLKSWTVRVSKNGVMSMVRSFREAIQGFSDVESQARELYDMLVAPAASYLEQAGTLCIVPHGLLHYLPFAALAGPKGYLGADFPIFYLPSASTMKYLSSGSAAEQNNRTAVLALGDPDIGDPSLALPFAEKEVMSIAQSMEHTTVLTGKEATENALKSLAGKYRDIHLACHGEFFPSTPLFSRLVLAPGSGEDGYLTVNEVFDLDLHADLVTLSACRTGLEAIRGGDELVGLNRAFMFAGAKSVLSSLWRVSDVATAVLVKRLYRYISQGISKLAALKKAQDVVRRYYPHPAYWAAFRMVGSPY